MIPVPRSLAAGAAAALLLASSFAWAQADEYDVKAAFLLNFARLIEWPDVRRPAEGDPMVVAVLGDEEVEQALTGALGAADVDGHPVRVRRISGPEDVEGAHIVFVSRDAKLPEPVIEAARATHALAVGESDGFARSGGVINFFLEDSRLRFEINTGAAKSAGLKVSSRLLRLAVLVEGGA